MAENESILERARRQGLARPSAGMPVPAGYFEDFARKMAESLPYRAEAEAPEAVAAAAPKTLWTRVRPYVYLAAMFAGIWLMLQMFAMMGGGRELKPIDDNPVLAEALSDDDFMFDYIYDDLSSYEIADQMMSDGLDMDDIENSIGMETGESSPSDGFVLPDSML